MQARIVAAARGARWLGEGWQLFRAAPLTWLGLAFAYLFITQLLAVIPVLGGPVALMLVPPFTVGLMAAARAACRKAPVEFAMLFDGFRNDLRAQLVLGAIYLGCVMAVFAGATFADADGVLSSMVSGSRRPERLQANELLAPLAVFGLLYTPVFMMFWFAPPLVAWRATGPVKALFFSFFACLMNWRAFLAYGAVTAAVALVVPFIALSALMLVNGAPQVPVMSLVFPLVLMLLPTLFASFYASYRDVFGGTE